MFCCIIQVCLQRLMLILNTLSKQIFLFQESRLFSVMHRKILPTDKSFIVPRLHTEGILQAWRPWLHKFRSSASITHKVQVSAAYIMEMSHLHSARGYMVSDCFTLGSIPLLYRGHRLRDCELTVLSPACWPWMMLSVPSGAPASWSNLARSMVHPGTRSEGFIRYVLPHTIPIGNIHRGIMAGKLKGAMPAHTPMGRRYVWVSMSLVMEGKVSPSIRNVMLQACSTTSEVRTSEEKSVSA